MHFLRKSRWPPKLVGKQFLRKVASRLCWSPVGQKFWRNFSICHHFRDKCVFVFYAEIQDGRQKWRGKPFLKKVTSTLSWYEITLSRTVSEINVCLRFTQKFKMAAKRGGKTICEKDTSILCWHPVSQKFRQNRSISHRVRDKCVFTFFCKNPRWPPKMAGKWFLGKVASWLCTYPVGQKFRRNRSILQIEANLGFLAFLAKNVKIQYCRHF